MQFFEQLNSLAFDQINIVIKSKENGDIMVTVKPHNFSNDEAYDNLRPLRIEGTPQEIEDDFVELIQKPLGVVHDKMKEAKEYDDHIKELELNTKAKKDIKEKLDKGLESAKKIVESEDFDIEKDAKKAINKYEKVLDIDKNNSTAKSAIEKLKADLSKKSSNLFS